MKRILYILCSILLLAGGLSAQAQKKPADHQKDMREKVRAEKRAFLMRELALTAGEVDALMPVLNELDDKRFALWRSTETLGRRVRQGDKTLTEAELNTHLEQMLDFQRPRSRAGAHLLPPLSLHGSPLRSSCACRWSARTSPAASSSVTSDSTRLAPSLLS